MDGFGYQKDKDGVATILIDMPGPVNVMNAAFTAGMAAAIDAIAADADVVGVVIASAKDTFFAGGDVKAMAAAPGAGYNEAITEGIAQARRLLRAIEKLNKPVAAAINGAALGGGYELTLACNYRIAWDDKSVLIGLPEATLGLLPGGGGVVRMTKKFGIQKALPLLLDGTTLSAQAALDAGLVDELVANRADLVPRARQWVLANKDNPLAATQPWDRPDYAIPGGDLTAPAVRGFVNFTAFRLFEETRGLLPNKPLIFDIAVESLKLDLDTALKIETRGLVTLILSPVGKNMMSANFFQANAVRRGGARPTEIERTRFDKIAVLGDGAVADALVAAAARAGLPVERALGAGLKGCQFVIDASMGSERAKVVSALDPGAVYALCSAGETLASLAPPEGALGLCVHADGKGVTAIEIVAPEGAGANAVAKTYDLARQLRVTPIWVNDAAGFYLGRTRAAQQAEAGRLLAEGVTATRINNLARAIGLKHDLVSDDGAVKHAAAQQRPSDQDIKDRLLFAPIIESLKCLEEGVLRSVAEGNIAALRAIGAPEWTGGYLQVVNTYDLKAFVARCEALALAYGERFAPPAIARRKLAAGETFA